MLSQRSASQTEPLIEAADEDWRPAPWRACVLSCCGGLLWAPLLPLIVMLPPAGLAIARKLHALSSTVVVPPSLPQERMLERYAHTILEAATPPDDLKWILCGFQSANPWTDFRGAGELGLRSLHWMATQHPQVLREVATDLTLDSTTTKRQLFDQPQYYPFSASFINVVFLIYHYCRIGSDLVPYVGSPAKWSKYGGSKSNAVRLLTMLGRGDSSAEDPWSPAFGDLVTLCCLKLHREWLRISRTSTLLEFDVALDKLPPMLDKIAGSQRRITRNLLRNVIAA